MENTFELTYDTEIAAAAESELGRSARSFQKSLADGKGDLYTIRRVDGRVVDIMREFDPHFG